MEKTSRTNTRLKPIEFRLSAPKAKKVALAGNFNNWDTKNFTAKKDTQGNWTIKVDLRPGKYEYKFFVDGTWTNDPRCNAFVSNNFGTQNCLVEVK